MIWFDDGRVIVASIAAFPRKQRLSSRTTSIMSLPSNISPKRDDPQNRALACDRCNAFKGPNLTSLDPETQQIVQLFHPRQQAWNDHFLLRGGYIIGLTGTGRATARLLNMNDPRSVALREQWIADAGGL